MLRFASLSVRTRILSAVITAALAAILVGVFDVNAIHTVFEHGNDIYSEAMVPNAEVAKIRETVFKFRFDSLSAATSVTQEAKQANTQLANADQGVLDAAIRSYGARHLTSTERSAFNEFNSYWSEYLKLRKQSDDLRAQGRPAEADDVKVKQVIPTTKAAMAALDKLYAASDAAA